MRLKKALTTILILASTGLNANVANTNSAFLRNRDSSEIIFTTGDLQDIRIFGKKTYWHIKKKDTQIFVTYGLNGIEKISFARFFKNRQLNIVYRKDGDSLKLKTAKIGAIQVYNRITENLSSANTGLCNNLPTANESISELLENMNSGDFKSKISSSIDPECSKVFDGTNEMSLLQKAVSSSLKLRSGESAFASCIEDNGSEIKPPLEPDQQKFLSANIKLISANVLLVNGPPLISCALEPIPKISAASAGQTTSDGRITIFKPSLENSSPIEKTVSHEILHKAGLSDEAQIESIVELCPYNSNSGQKSDTLKIGQKGETYYTHSAPTRSVITFPNQPTGRTVSDAKERDFRDGLSDIFPEITPEVAKGLPTTITPVTVEGTPQQKQTSESSTVSADGAKVATNTTPSQEVRMPSVNELATTRYEGSPHVESSMNRIAETTTKQSAGLFSWAETVTNAIVGSPAYASPKASSPASVASASRESSTSGNAAAGGSSASSPRSPASDKSSGQFASSASSKTQESSATASVPSSIAQGSSVNLAKIAASSESTRAIAEGSSSKLANISGGGSSESSNSNSPSTSRSASSSFSSSSTTSQGPSYSSNRAVASSENSTSTSNGTTSPEELRTFFRGSDYQSAKARLSEPKMIQDMVTNKVQISTVENRFIGYQGTDAKVKILDTGNSFVFP